MKLSQDGSIDWQKTYDNALNNDYGFTIQQTLDGGYILAGKTVKPDGTDNSFWVLKLNSDGTVYNQAKFPQSYEETDFGQYGKMPTLIQQTNDGGYIIANPRWDGTPGSKFKAWVTKITAFPGIPAFPTVSWQKEFDIGAANTYIRGIQQTADGGFVLTAAEEVNSLLVFKLGPNGELDGCSGGVTDVSPVVGPSPITTTVGSTDVTVYNTTLSKTTPEISNLPLTSSVTDVCILKAGTTTTLSSSPNPALEGQLVTFTTTVTPDTAGGTVTFKDGEDTLGTGTLSAGQATFSTSLLAAGVHSITAEYGGNPTYNGSTSSVLSQTINTPAPEINLKQGTTDIPNAGTYSFENVQLGSSSPITFTIENTGNGPLNLWGVPTIQITGSHASDFIVNTQPASPVAPLSSTTFVITFTPSATGHRSATVSIPNNDADENPYTIAISGTGDCTTNSWKSAVNGNLD